MILLTIVGEKRLDFGSYKMTDDMFIGFERELLSLEEFLRKEKYTRAEKLDEKCIVYTRAGDLWPKIFYSSIVEVDEQSGISHWEEAGHKVVSEVNLNYHAGDTEDLAEAERLRDKIGKEFDGIIFDSHSDDYLLPGEY